MPNRVVEICHRVADKGKRVLRRQRLAAAFGLVIYAYVLVGCTAIGYALWSVIHGHR